MMTNVYKVQCNCGHVGGIKLKENDTPYSASFYEYYSLVDLDGSSFNTEGSAGWEKAFLNMKPRCPNCHARLTPKHLII